MEHQGHASFQPCGAPRAHRGNARGLRRVRPRPTGSTAIQLWEENAQNAEDASSAASIHDAFYDLKGLYWGPRALVPSDVLSMRCFQEGAAVFEYNSQPGYFSGTPLAPQATGVAALARLFKLREGAFDPFLKAETVKSHVFAEALLADIDKELGQPLWPIGMGYSFLAERPEFIAILRKQGLQIVEVP